MALCSGHSDNYIYHLVQHQHLFSPEPIYLRRMVLKTTTDFCFISNGVIVAMEKLRVSIV
jgi:hypothetical protein